MVSSVWAWALSEPTANKPARAVVPKRKYFAVWRCMRGKRAFIGSLLESRFLRDWARLAPRYHVLTHGRQWSGADHHLQRRSGLPGSATEADTLLPPPHSVCRRSARAGAVHRP